MVKWMENITVELLAEKLLQFGLTRQGATIYLCLLRNKELSGYEVSKLTGISRSNVYSALAGLVDAGAAYLLEGVTSKYTAVSIEEFCQNRIRQLEQLKQELVSWMPQVQEDVERYVTISGHRHIMDKIYNMLAQVEHRVYLSMPADYLDPFIPQFQQLVSEGKKVVLLTDRPLLEKIPGCIFYLTQNRDRQVKLIVDSSSVLTGEMNGDKTDTCLYCGQKNFVQVFKDSLRNEIRLIELTKGDNQI